MSEIVVRSVLISGAASGIGAALVEHCLARGDSVLAVDLDANGLARHPANERLTTAVVDVRDPAAWARAIGQRHIDVLLNVAGYLKPGYAHETNADDVARHIDINVKGVIFGVQSVLPRMLERGSGHIVNIASLAGLSAVPGLALYSASKFAVRAYSLSIAEELRTKGISVTVICPDAVQTPMLDLQKSAPQAALTFSGATTPLTVNDVVRAVDHALQTKRLEIMLPFSRGLLAKLGNAFPVVTGAALRAMQKRGQKRQQKLSPKN